MGAPESFGERVRRLREAKRLERRTLAELVPMPYSTLAEIENQGKESTKVSYLVGLAAALEVSLLELCTGEEDEQASVLPAPTLTPREKEMLRAFRAMTPREKKGLEAYIASLAAQPSRSKRRERAASATAGAQERTRRAS